MNEKRILGVIKRKAKYIGIVFGVLALAIFVGRKTTIDVFSNLFAENERKLPIYCVDTEEKKVAISFDAAWGK